jgi:hypothetical protein
MLGDAVTTRSGSAGVGAAREDEARPRRDGVRAGVSGFPDVQRRALEGC